jgi:magnesium chelatase family protein
MIKLADEMREHVDAALVEGIEVLPAGNLRDLVDHLRGDRLLETYFTTEIPKTNETSAGDGMDLGYVKGQEHVKRAMEVAAAGGHNLVMMGPPGAGKTLLARCLPTILPTMDRAEALDVTKIYSIAGLLPSEKPLVSGRPFRAPHYTVSNAGLVGGGQWPRPGEITLAHRGVLFLDEMPEFGHQVLEVLRQPLEDKSVTISRAQGSLTFPANFMLVGAMNPCPCGYYGDSVKPCSCSPTQISRYQRRISGPLLDRIDIFVDVPRVEYDKLTDDRLGEPSSSVRSRVEDAREAQRQRFNGPNMLANADMDPIEVREHCPLESGAQGLLRSAMESLHLSARGFHRILKLARTIADMEQASEIGSSHLAEALQYRPRELAS